MNTLLLSVNSVLRLIFPKNHVALRVMDMATSVRYYTETLGLNLIKTVENRTEGFRMCFLGYPSEGPFSTNEDISHREGLLGLISNYDLDNEAIVRYHNGNDHPQGFGHICKKSTSFSQSLILKCNIGVSVDDIGAACHRLERLEVSWKKRLTDGKMKNVAFLLDPDNYWIELVQNEGFTGKANF